MIGFCGNIAAGKKATNGQTIKTRIVLSEMKKHFPNENFYVIDTEKIHANPIRGMCSLIRMLVCADIVVILPAHSAIRILAVLLWMLRKESRTYYVVIGGWLSDMLEKRPWLLKRVINYGGVFVETKQMFSSLEIKGFKNIFHMPNCKDIKIQNPDIHSFSTNIFRYCTFSRISREKGIEDAIRTITKVHDELENVNVYLDIYGEPDEDYRETFEELCKQFPDYIRYKGLVQYDEATEVLKSYYMLLFPTFYEGEGFPGTIIDAFSSSVPVIASDWKYNSEIVSNGITGIIYPGEEVKDLKSAVLWSIENREKVLQMRKECYYSAQNYSPNNVMKQFMGKVKERLES